jgi:hypothetical protein
MIFIMKLYWFFVCALIFVGPVVFANELIITEVAEPYAVVPIEGDFEYKKLFLGELSDYPIMYEFEVDEETIVPFVLRQIYNKREDPLRLALIMVQPEESGGVKEIVRHNPSLADWQVVKSPESGVTFWESVLPVKNLTPGIYRVEVSTPQNQGKYLLELGENDQTLTPFETLGNIRTVHKFFGFSFFKILTVPVVYYPLGIILLLIAIFFTWRYHTRKLHA